MARSRLHKTLAYRIRVSGDIGPGGVVTPPVGVQVTNLGEPVTNLGVLVRAVVPGG